MCLSRVRVLWPRVGSGLGSSGVNSFCFFTRDFPLGNVCLSLPWETSIWNDSVPEPASPSTTPFPLTSGLGFGSAVLFGSSEESYQVGPVACFFDQLTNSSILSIAPE